MDELYVEVFSEPEDGWLMVPLETLITLFVLRYCLESKIPIKFVVKQSTQPTFQVKVLRFDYELLLSEDELPRTARLCLLPLVIVAEDNTCVAGLCGVSRQLIKSAIVEKPTHWARSLLGFRGGCLLACAESSIWTCFCEVDIVQTVKKLIKLDSSDEIAIPENVARFEAHMAQPIRMHNIQKKAQEISRKKGKVNWKEEVTGDALEHCFAEGPLMTLADVILLPCFHIIIQSIHSESLMQYIPLTLKWYKHILSQDRVMDCLSIIREAPCKVLGSNVNYCVCEVPKQSLYKSDPRRYKPRNRIFTRQDDIDASLVAVDALGLPSNLYNEPFGSDVQFNWESLPFDAQPEGSELPTSRRERKSQQLENLTKAILKVARSGHTIVDFCSGSGHLGIILAHLLPQCHVILLENKEESLCRGRIRVAKLKLNNVSFCQCNLDYFVGKFDVGTSLHACGVATDLVIQCCISQRAVFVCCPCCYGSVQNTHIITYPRSQLFRNSTMTLQDYLVLGHSADQTHDEKNAKTDQGKKCMSIIDKDRCLQASEAGYSISLAKLVPETCTPKNNLLVGIPDEWSGLSSP